MRLAAIALLLLAACDGPPQAPRRPSANTFPTVERPVAEIVSAQFSDEESRERVGEAAEVMDLVGVAAGETVADIGAGRGYYSGRLAERVRPDGFVYAEDIFQRTVTDLRRRLAAEGHTNVKVVLGTPGDPKLPPRSLDHALMIHMYHEIENPYELLWNLRTSLKPDATVAIVDTDRPTRLHGTPPWLLACEVAAIGFQQQAFQRLGDGKSYLALFKAIGPRPRPLDIQPCRSGP
jgi:ubiquinone/menaquinone biosynthesis C-methylase UbiE